MLIGFGYTLWPIGHKFDLRENKPYVMYITGILRSASAAAKADQNLTCSRKKSMDYQKSIEKTNKNW